MLNLHYAYYKSRNETYSCKADHVWQRKVPVLIVHRVIPFAIRRLPPDCLFGELNIIVLNKITLFQLIFTTKQSIPFLSTILRIKL